MIVVLPKSLTAKTEAKAADVMADLQAIANVVNGKLDLENFAESLRNSLLPTGMILPTARAAAPAGFLLCEGQAVSRTTYAVLFAAIGTTFGGGDGVTTFNVPDLRGRAPVGADSGAGRLSEGAGNGGPNALGKSGGSQLMPAHGHNPGTLGTSIESANHGHNLGWVGGQVRHEGSGFAYGTNVESFGNTTTGVETGPHTHAIVGRTANEGLGGSGNMPPYQVVKFAIKT